MTRKPRAYMTALPAAALPELQELMDRFAGPEARRSNVVMMRLSDGPLRHVDELVDVPQGAVGETHHHHVAPPCLGSGEAIHQLLQLGERRGGQGGHVSAGFSRHLLTCKSITQPVKRGWVRSPAGQGRLRETARNAARVPSPGDVLACGSDRMCRTCTHPHVGREAR